MLMPLSRIAVVVAVVALAGCSSESGPPPAARSGTDSKPATLGIVATAEAADKPETKPAAEATKSFGDTLVEASKKYGVLKGDVDVEPFVNFG